MEKRELSRGTTVLESFGKRPLNSLETVLILSSSDGSMMIEQEPPEVHGPWARPFSRNPTSWYRWPRPHAPGLIDRQHC